MIVWCEDDKVAVMSKYVVALDVVLENSLTYPDTYVWIVRVRIVNSANWSFARYGIYDKEDDAQREMKKLALAINCAQE